MDDLRTNSRIETSLAARISAAGVPSVPCVIKDMSDTGAKIDVDVALLLPSEFDLAILATGETLRAEIRWRYGHKVGVRFIRQGGQAHDEPTREALIVENGKLRDALEAMAKRLTQLGELVVLPVEVTTPLQPNALRLEAREPAYQAPPNMI